MIEILQGDWIDQLRTLPDCSVQCCVTSPPYLTTIRIVVCFNYERWTIQERPTLAQASAVVEQALDGIPVHWAWEVRLSNSRGIQRHRECNLLLDKKARHTNPKHGASENCEALGVEGRTQSHVWKTRHLESKLEGRIDAIQAARLRTLRMEGFAARYSQTRQVLPPVWINWKTGSASHRAVFERPIAGAGHRERN